MRSASLVILMVLAMCAKNFFPAVMQEHFPDTEAAGLYMTWQNASKVH